MSRQSTDLDVEALRLVLSYIKYCLATSRSRYVYVTSQKILNHFKIEDMRERRRKSARVRWVLETLCDMKLITIHCRRARGKIYCVDLNGTLAKIVSSLTIEEAITVIRQMYGEHVKTGHTARSTWA